MSPTQDNPNTTPEKEAFVDLTPAVNEAPSALESSPEADLAALQVIEALEAEDNIINTELIKTQEASEATILQSSQPIQPVEQPQLVVSSPPLIIEAQPIEEPEPVLIDTPLDTTVMTPAVAIANSLNEETPVVSSPDPFAKPKKSPKKLIILLVIIVLLAGAGVAGYFFWQSTQQPIEVIETTQEVTTETQPDENIQAEVLDKETLVTEGANSLEKEADAIDDSAYNDSTLSDTSLYEN